MNSAPPWFDEPTNQIMQLLRNGKMPHAMLLQGAQGWGVDQLANEVVVRLFNLGDVDVREVAHPDLRCIEGKDDAIKIDQIRLLIDFMMRTRQNAPIKVALVMDAEKMTISAANGILKMLEEPPDDHLLILTSIATETLLPTIVSRCQRIVMRKYNSDVAQKWLIDQRIGDDKTLTAYLVEYGGAPFAVYDAIQNKTPLLWNVLLDIRSDSRHISEIAGTWRGENPTNLIARWQRLVHRCVKHDSAGEGMFRFYDELTDTRRMFREIPSLSMQLQFERLLFRWCDLELEGAVKPI